MANLEGSIISYRYHKTAAPTNVPIIIDNNLFILTEQLSRDIVDTRLINLIPCRFYNVTSAPFGIPYNGQEHIPNNQTQTMAINSWSPLSGNVEQQINLYRMHQNHVMDTLYSNAINKPIPPQVRSAMVQTIFYRDSSTNTYDTYDVEMKCLN